MNTGIKLYLAVFGLIISMETFAGPNSLYQQRVETAVPDQEALAHSEKLIREHKDVVVQKEPVIPVFHKQSGDLETAPKTFCRNCHAPLPHHKQLRTRAFNNMHVRFIACETCHFRPKDSRFTYQWFDYDQDQTTTGKGLFRVGQKIDNAKQRPANPKIAPLYQGQRVFVLKDEPFSQSLAAQWEKADAASKPKLRAKIHWPLEKKGPACHDCHDENKSMLDLKALGATEEESKSMAKHVIPQFFRRYEKDDQKITIRDMLQ